ncbi:type II toxin-antitoxin system prevent-host-death family antitoxin [Rhizobiales bacterium TNE-4]|nr:type II toxin-antitoxin system prevent-host-death family antitoxin [Rhizobiales bacterium TNE-4]MBV1827156.1 type II toxin-antitoxin system prevent-host-death family antitoxin [Rhizobiales bacterium TNE-4]
MKVSVSDAKAHLTELVRRAEAGEEVILTRHGQPAVRLVAAQKALTAEEKHKIINDIVASIPAPVKESLRPADRSHDFLYDENGLPV